jgi:glycosyltransferase involved in cell wall biosynthesis
MTVPDVSVIVPAYNAMPYFVRCLDSLEGQTIGADRMEIIVIDDGSTDGTAEEAARRAAAKPALYRVERHPASGGPARPRNRALEIASGRYVFFLDADDYLGLEALDRLVTVADEEGSDVVAGRMVSDNGRPPGGSMFTRTERDADLFNSGAYWSISALKLYRRSMLEQHQIRFPTRFPVLSDQPFAALAYLRASKISLMADYDYYWVVQREDGQHVTLSGKLSDRLDVAEAMCNLLAREVEDPDHRARLLSRHFQLELRRVVAGLPECEPSEQHHLLDRIATVVHQHLTPAVAAQLTALQRLLYHLAGRRLLDPLLTVVAFDPRQEQQWEVTVSQGRAYAQLPFFRDASLDVPDDIYDVTDQMRFDQHLTSYSWTGATLHLHGHIAWRRIAVDDHDTVEVVLTNRDDPETTHVVPARRTGPDTFTADLDTLTLADGDRLPDGIWNVHVQLTRGDLTQTQQCNLDEACSRATFLHCHPEGEWSVGSFITPQQRLQLDIGQRSHAVSRAFGEWQLSWHDDCLVVQGLLDMHLEAPLSLIARHPDHVVEHDITLHDGRFTGAIPLADLAPGRWAIRIRVGRPPHHRGYPVPAPPDLHPHPMRHGTRRTVAEPAALDAGGLALDITAPTPVDSLKHAIRQRISRQD